MFIKLSCCLKTYAYAVCGKMLEWEKIGEFGKQEAIHFYPPMISFQNQFSYTCRSFLLIGPGQPICLSLPLQNFPMYSINNDSAGSIVLLQEMNYCHLTYTIGTNINHRLSFSCTTLLLSWNIELLSISHSPVINKQTLHRMASIISSHFRYKTYMYVHIMH